MATDAFADTLRALLDPVGRLHALMSEVREHAAVELQAIDPLHRDSALNLLHYLALRRHDLRELQDRLASVGLSSLGRAEPCVAATVANVLELVARGCGAPAAPRDPTAMTLAVGSQLLERNTCALLGPARRARRVRIMVTLPSQAADDPRLARDLIASGMDVARINCAHDDAPAWERMIAHVRRGAGDLGVGCQVLMDLAGPKLRTGALPSGPEVVKIRPARDERGRVLAPALVWLSAPGTPAPLPSVVRLPVDGAWAAGLSLGDGVRLSDARHAHRRWPVLQAGGDGALVEAHDTAYVESGTRLHAAHGEARVGQLPALEQSLLLQRGSRMVLTREPHPGGETMPPSIPCTLPQVFADVRHDDHVWFDDGAIGGRVVEVASDRLTIEITDASPAGSRLRADKGINLPDTELRLPALSDKDAQDLRFICLHADLVGYSFVRRPSDVFELHDRLAALDRPDLGLLLKIETRDAFEQLPALLLAAMRRRRAGVMIARGDLAIECGWERLAELQEEILWICEAAHLPVVWATQVLEHLAKDGRPSRAEITDAAMSQRAECVMLNKGPHLVGAVELLDDILRRMAGHQSKKRAMLRPLALAERFARRPTDRG